MVCLSDLDMDTLDRRAWRTVLCSVQWTLTQSVAVMASPTITNVS